MGLPVIAPYSGGIPEIVLDAGILVDEKFSNNKDYFYDDLYRIRNFSLKEINYLMDIYSKAFRDISSNLNFYTENAKNVNQKKLNMRNAIKSYLAFIDFLEKN